MNQKKYADKFKDFFLGLALDKDVKTTRGMGNLRFVEGEEVLRFFMESMDLEDEDELLELQEEWYKYIDEELEFSGENALIWEAKTAKSLGETKRAVELYKKAFEENIDAAPAAAHYDYFQLMGSPSNKEGIKHLRLAVKKAPLTATFRYALGEALEDKSGKAGEEGEMHKALAIELDPDVERSVIVIEFD